MLTNVQDSFFLSESSADTAPQHFASFDEVLSAEGVEGR